MKISLLLSKLCFFLFDSRTNLAFFINLCIFLFIVYESELLFKPFNIFAFVTGYLFADFLSGVVHIYLDHSAVVYDGSYADFARMGFQVHHLYPTFPWMMDDAYEPYMECNTIFPYVNAVCLLNALTLNIPVVHYGAFWVVSFQAAHYYAHARTHGKVIPFLVKQMQEIGLIIHPQTHQKHHKTFDTNYCILNGFANPLCNYLADDEKKLDEFVALLDKNPAYMFIFIAIVIALAVVLSIGLFGIN